MQGLTITDSIGRRILSTHFTSPLISSLAIDSALHSNLPITWVPSSSLLSPSTDQDDDDEEEDTEEKPWAAPTTKGGIVVCQVERKGLRYITPVDEDIDPIIPLHFLELVYEALESYIGGPVTEPSIKDHFDTILPLLEEMLSSSSGLPLQTSTSQLRDLVPPASSLASKVVSTATNLAAGGGGSTNPTSLLNSQASSANALISSGLPWRRQGIKYGSNEIYFDLTETLGLLLSQTGTILSGSINGSISCRSKVSGTPDLILSFADPTLLKPDEVAFHPCVRQGKWRKEKVVSFVPPDGAFPLLTYHLSPVLPLPLSLHPTLTSGPLGGTFSLSLTSRSSTPFTNILIKVPLPKGVGGVSFSSGGGGSRWEWLVEEEVVGWWIERVGVEDRERTLEGKWEWGGTTTPSTTPTTASSISLSFESSTSLFSNVRVQSVKLVQGFGSNEGGGGGNLYKGVRTSSKGVWEVRV